MDFLNRLIRIRKGVNNILIAIQTIKPSCHVPTEVTIVEGEYIVK